MASLHIETPLVKATEISRKLGRDVLLKLESMQPSGSFKIRGIGHLAQKAVAAGCSKLVSSSGGNAGLATAYVGRELGVAVTVVVPETTLAKTRGLIAGYGAEIVVHGSAWDEADILARQLASAPGQYPCRHALP